ncbi:MAG: efflux RND transporter periplasmic adaptor subunit [Rhodospirillaceae bacterium]
MKSSWWIAVGIVVVTVGWIGSGELFPSDAATTADGAEASADADPNTANAAPAASSAGPEEPADLTQVRIVNSVAQDRAESIVVLGRTHEMRSVALRAQTNGRVQAVPVARGAMVEAGAAMAILEEGDRPARVARAQTLVEQRQMEFNAASQLAARNFASRVSEAEARSNLDEALADLTEQTLDLEHTVISAPFNGRLEDRYVELGDYLSVGDEVATIVDLDPLRILANVSERTAARLKWGQKGTAVLLDGRELSGRITYVSTQTDPVTRTFQVELEVPNPESAPEGQVMAGMTAELRIDIGSSRAHLLSPAALTLSNDGQVGIMTVDDADIVHFFPAIPRGDASQGVWVDGLPETARVITVGHAFVTEGQQVAPLTEAEIEALSAQIAAEPDTDAAGAAQ